MRQFTSTPPYYYNYNLLTVRMVELDVVIFMQVLETLPNEIVGRFFVDHLEKYCISTETADDPNAHL